MASSNSGSRPTSGRNSSGRPASGRSASSSGRNSSGRTSSGRPASDRSSRSSDSRAGRPSRGTDSRDTRSSGSRDDRPRRDGDARPSAGRTSSGRPASDRSSRSGDSRPGRPSRTTDSRDTRSSGLRDDRPRRDGDSRSTSERSSRPARSTDSRDSRPGRPSRGVDSRDTRSSGPREDRPRREGGSREDRPARTWSRDDRPKASDDRRKPGRPASGARSGSDRDSRSTSRDGRSPRGGAGRRDDRNDTRRDSSRFTDKRVNVNDPIIPDHITGEELDRSVRNELRTLPDGLALRVARHLATSNELALVDPELSWLHAKAALDKAARVGIVREAAAEAAYRAGHYAIALNEFRAAKRITGAREYWPLMADCERALGRPAKAIAMASDPVVAKLERKDRVEMRIVVAGARADQGNLEAALATLKCPELTTTSVEPWAARIRYAYADVLEQLGNTEEAIEWFHRAAAVDLDGQTDADDRIAMLEGTYVEPTEDSLPTDVIIDVTDDDEDE